jgi:cytochrome c-type biogenesis protein CcmH
MVLAQQSDDEIKNFLVKRYGEFILLKPRFNKLTIMLWAFPLMGFAFIFFFLHRFFRKSHTTN